jgi:hydroxypyruvate isomerase
MAGGSKREATKRDSGKRHSRKAAPARHAARSAAAPQVGWKLRFAAPLGFPTFDRPQFLHSVGSADPVEQIAYLADLGFAGVQDNSLKARGRDEQERIGKALAKHGLEMGCFVDSPKFDVYWGRSDKATQELIRKRIHESIDAGRRANGRCIVVGSPRDAAVPAWYETANMMDNLRRAAEWVEKAGMVICLEPVWAARVPGLLLHHVGDAYVMARAVDSPAVKLVFDTVHVQGADGDLLGHLARVEPEVAVVQVADVPGRLEPGSGEINFPNFLRRLRDSGYRGLVELEHNFSRPGTDGEQAALRALQDINAAI